MTAGGHGGGLAAPALRRKLREIEQEFSKTRQARDAAGMRVQALEHEATARSIEHGEVLRELASLLDATTGHLARGLKTDAAELLRGRQDLERAIWAAKMRLGRAT